jgi:hypothetical protein
VDCGVSLIAADGRPSHRRPLRPVRAAGRVGISRHQAHWPSGAGHPAAVGPWLTTASVVRGCWEVRLVHVAADGPAGQWTLWIGGWQVAADEPLTQREGPGTVSVHGANGLASHVVALHGAMIPAVRRPVGAGAFGPHAAAPCLRSAAQVRPGDGYAAAVALSADPAGPGEPPRLTVYPGRAGHLTAAIGWADGEQDRVSL